MARQKRVERFQTKRFRNPGGTVSWRVTGTLPNGDRIRENYATKTDAINRKAELEGEAAAADAEVRLRSTFLTEDQLADAESALVAAGNRSLSGVVHKLQQVEQVAQEKGTSVNAILRFFQQHFREEIQSVTLLDAYDRFMAAKEQSGIYPRTVTFYRNSVKLLLEPDPSRFVHEIRVADLEKILGCYPNLNTRQTYRRAFTTFFAWAKRHHHCLENPCERLDKIPADDKRIAILSLPEIKRLLKAATEWKGGSMTASVALALFAGLRPSEIAGLAHEDIRENGIRVRGGKLRRKTSRMVPIPANLRQWLAAYPFTGLPSHHQRSYRVLRKATKARNWAQDVLRHTSISFQLERDQDEARALT